MNADDHRFHPHHRQKDRRALLPPGQRHLPSGASGTLRQTRQNAHRLRQPHAHGGRHRHALPWARAVWTWPWPWAAARIISPTQNATLVKLTGALRPMVSAKDVILEVLRCDERKGRRGQDRGIRRRGREKPDGAPARHHHQYGRGAGRYHLHFPIATKSPAPF